MLSLQVEPLPGTWTRPQPSGSLGRWPGALTPGPWGFCSARGWSAMCGGRGAWAAWLWGSWEEAPCPETLALLTITPVGL